MRYFVRVYVSHVWPPNFGLISVQSLISTPKSLLFNPISFLRLPQLVFSVCGLVEHAHGAQMRVGGGVTRVAKSRSRMCAQNYSGAKVIVPAQGQIPGPSAAPGPVGDWGVELRGSSVSMFCCCRSYNFMTLHFFVFDFNNPYLQIFREDRKI